MRTCAESRNWSTSFPNGFLAAAAPSDPQPAPPTSLSNRSMDAHQTCHGTIERSECKIEAVLARRRLSPSEHGPCPSFGRIRRLYWVIRIGLV
jgi:hypothetical protein